MIRGLVLLALLVLPFGAQAQFASYCNGNIVAERFDTNVTTGPSGRATYSVMLRNTQSRAMGVLVNVTAPLLGRPVGVQQIRANGTLLVQLGYQTYLPGSPPLRGERLEQVTRISCL